MASQRSGVLELAVLGLLHETPMHGYELRKRLNAVLGAFRAFGYGSLYPCLKELLAQGMIAEEEAAPATPMPLSGRRSKIVYRLTADGRRRLRGQDRRDWQDGHRLRPHHQQRGLRQLLPHPAHHHGGYHRQDAAASGPLPDLPELRDDVSVGCALWTPRRHRLPFRRFR
jgi:DNA-binding PadR family transcriptional regulator